MQRGELVQWNDARGFGFIASDRGERYFVHISAIERIATRPREGDIVRFVPARGADGRLQARNAVIEGANPVRHAHHATAPEGMNFRWDWRYGVSALLVIGLIGAVSTDTALMPLVLAYAGMGLVSLWFYGSDKRFARTGQWRHSEVLLHGLDLCFGIVGGLLAQALFRHKTRKPVFVATALLIASVHLFWLVSLAAGWFAARDLVDLFRF